MLLSIQDIISSYRRYGTLTYTELLWMVIPSIVFGFVFSFRKWGDSLGNYDPVIGFSNLFFYTVFSFLGLYMLNLGYRISAISYGYKPVYKPFKSGLFANVFVTFLTNGFGIFLSPGGFDIKPLEGVRLGRFRHLMMYKERSTIVFWGFFTVSIYALLVKLVFGQLFGADIFAMEMIIVAYIICLWSLFPADIILRIWLESVPISNGTTLIYGGLSKAVGTLVYLLFSFLFIVTFSGIFSIILALLLSGIAYLTFFLFADPQKKIY